MEELTYIGEHTWAGQLGHALLLANFMAILLSALSFFLSERYKDNTWRKVGVIAFRLHSLFLIAAIAVLFVMLYNKWYEYDYVTKHRNNVMPLRYILSCFWEGHEGSFLLWSFWHMVLGNVLILKAKDWVAPVMTFIATANVFLGSMVLGLYFGELRVGSSPFLLMRELPSNIGLPWTQIENYLDLEFFKDGTGLNPLLQNYWMTIHPPTVFLGFASTIVPAAFASAGLWRREYRAWIRPALPWTYFGILILGVGILMGGAWAYEALSFGGFWAWDPVENSSLVPWIIIVAAGHVMLVNRDKARSTYSALLLAMAGFIFVIYSNFLTNSGVLGDTSVHAFTDNGLGGQLVIYMGFFVALCLGLLMTESRFRMSYWIASILSFIVALGSGQLKIGLNIWLMASVIMSIYSYHAHYPKDKDDEKIWSREFWMFIGSLVLVMSALQITFMTSKPVFNVIAEPLRGGLMTLYDLTGWESLQSLATGTLAERSQDEVIAQYNRWQTPFAFVITLLIAFAQFLRWKDTPLQVWLKRIIPSVILALVATGLTLWRFELTVTGGDIALILLLFGCWWAIMANLDYLLRIARGNVNIAGSTIAHIGFGLILLGAAVSTSQSKKISLNTSMTDLSELGEQFSNQEDLLLFEDVPRIMGDYYVTYKEKAREGVNIYFSVDYHELSPRAYKKDELIFLSGEVLRCKVDHQASMDMLSDIKNHWEPLDFKAGAKELAMVEMWTPYGQGKKLFTLNPLIQTNPKFGEVAEPDTKHYLDRDVYTHVRYANLDDPDEVVDEDGYMPYKENIISLGDTIRSGARLLILERLLAPNYDDYDYIDTTDIAVKASIRLVSPEADEMIVEPVFHLKDQQFLASRPLEVEELGVKIHFKEIFTQDGTFNISVAEKEENLKDFIVMQAIMFPWINILWVGIIIMALGTLIAIIQRVRKERGLEA